MTSQLSKDLASLRIRRDEPPKRRPWGSYVLGGALLVGAPTAYVAGKPMIEARLFKAEVAATEIVSVSPGQATVDLTSTGYLVPQVVAKLGADVPGRIVKVAVAEGKPVHAGDLLFEIDHAPLDAQIAAAKAKVAAAHARVASAKATVAEAMLPFEREKKLVQEGASTRAAAEDLGARVTSLTEQVHAAEAEVSAAQAEVQSLEAQLPEYVVKSPIDGVAQNKPAEIGDVVIPEQPLVELVDPKSLLLEADVPEARIALVKIGQPCEVVLESLPDKHLRGRVVELGPRINRTKATAIVKVAIEEAPERLAPDMSARVSFLAKDLDTAALNAAPKIIVPKVAVVDRGGQKVVFVLRDGKVDQVRVELGGEAEGGFELLSGPPAGTKVVKNPADTLRDGQAVKEGSS